jgi:hypothetical protein
MAAKVENASGAREIAWRAPVGNGILQDILEAWNSPVA